MSQNHISNVAKTLPLAIMLSLLSGCGPSEKDSAVDQQPMLPPSGPVMRKEFVSIPISLTEKTASLSLASSTTYTIALTGCASGYTSIAHETSSNLQVYKFDRNCLAKLTQFQLNGFTYQPHTDFTTWQAGDTAVFQSTTNATDQLTVKVITTLASPISGTESVHYQFSTIVKGSDSTLGQTDVGDAHTMTVDGQAAPSFTVKSVQLTGISNTGAGQFNFVLECTSNITGNAGTTACLDVLYSDITYTLVEDTYGSTMTYANAQALFPGTASSVNVNTDVVAVGAGGTVHGGFNSVTLDGPAAMHLHPHMILVIAAANLSYLYFNVDVTILTQD